MSDLNLYYKSLKEIRELFHSIGKIEDSNAKLDEIIKYLSIFIYATSQGKNYYRNFERNISLTIENPKKLDTLLRNEFLNVSKDINFENSSGTNIYQDEGLLTNYDDHLIVRTLISFMLTIFEEREKEPSFDIINEIFGSFIRDNFRGNVEDAQFLTPTEAIDFCCKSTLLNIKRNNIKKSFIVADPFCGVGSFLTRFHSLSLKLDLNVRFIGQDKISRMSRFAHINFLLSKTDTKKLDGVEGER